MKTFGCVAALVGLTIGFASAGPVAVSGDGSSMCNIKCGAQRFKYTPGKSYHYKYATKTETALEQSSDEKSTIYLDADVTLQAIDSCRFALKVESVRLEEEVSGGGRKASKGTHELSESLTKTPLIFNYEDGVVTRLCPAQHESKSALNIKRGILSMIQNKMRSYFEVEIAVEEDVNGACLTEYSAKKEWGGQIKVLKQKQLDQCTDVKEQIDVVSVIAVSEMRARSSSKINGTQECQQTIKNSILDSVECNERHVVMPFSRQEKGAATEVHQSLRFQRAGAATVNDVQYTEGEEETLRFDPTPNIELLDSQAEPQARSIIQRLGNDKSTDIKVINNDFAELPTVFRKMRYETLKKLVIENKTNQWVISALVDTMTRDAMRVMAELVKSRSVPTDLAEDWLFNVALTSAVDMPRIQMLLPLLDMEEFTVQAHLSIAAVARTYMEENPSMVPEEINRLLRRLYSQVKPETPGKLLIASIKAIGNIGIATGQEHKLLEVTAHKDTATRLAAYEAFRRFPCDPVKRDPLMRIFTDGSESTEVRIAAYLNSIRCPTTEMITTIRDTLLREPKRSPLASFVFTHVKNLEKHSLTQGDFSPITTDESLKSLEIDADSFSKNFYSEMFLNPIDMGYAVDAGSIMTENNMNFMLSTTLDVLGYKANIFDSKVRIQKDMSYNDLSLRLFGNEVFYTSAGKNTNSDVDAFLKSVMSRNGWKFSRSMTFLDSETILSTGNGLPLVVGVSGTGTLDVDLKAMPLQGQQGSKYVAEIRSAPSMAIQLGMTMMAQAPQTKSGIKMVVSSSSQWDLNGRVNIDMTGSSIIRNIQIEAPRDRSDLIDLRSDVYLVGSDGQHEIKAVGSQQKHLEMCTGNAVHVLAGHKACVEATYQAAIGEDAPFFLLRGPSHLNVRWEKTDKSLKMFQIQSSFVLGERDLLELAFDMDTPGSQVDRKFKGRFYRDLRSRKFGLDLVSPLKSLNLEGNYQETPSDKKTELLVKVDGKTEMSILGAMHVANGRATMMSPTLEVMMRDRKILLIKSEIASHGSQKYNGDIEIQSIWNQKPIKMNGEYSVVNNNKRLTFGMNSAWLQYNMQSSLLQQGSRQWEVNAAGDFIYNQGSKQTFDLGGKFWDDSESVSVEMKLQRDGKTFVSTKGKLDKKMPLNVDMAVELLEGRYKAVLGLESEDSKAALVAMALIDSEKYATEIEYQRQPSLTSFSGKFELPNNVERHLTLQYDIASPVKRLVFDSDLIGKPYSARVSYMPADKLHKVSASIKMDKESAALSAMLSTDPVYQTSLNIVHNGAKLLSTTFGVNMDRNKPDVKLFIQLREQPLVDLDTDTRIGPHKVTIGLKMRAPIEVSATAALSKSGSVGNTLSLKADIDVNSPDRLINLAVTSSAEISLWQRSNKVNIQTSLQCPGGNSEIVFNNFLDASSWSLDWRFQGPGQPKHHIQSTGTYSLELPKLHLRGGLDMNIRPFERNIVVDGLVLDTELSLLEEQIAFRTEVLSNTGASIFNVAAKLGNAENNKLASLDMNLWGKPYLVKVELDGQDLRSGFRTTFDGKCQDKTISGKGDLRWDGQHVLFNMDFQSSFSEFANTKLLLQTQTFSEDTTLINSEYALGQHHAKAEVIVDSSSLQADIKTSIRDWQNLKAQARWELKPKMMVVVDFSSAKYPNNVLEFEMETQNGIRAKLRVAAPTLYRGNYLEGDLKYTNGNGVLNLLHMGQEKAKLLFSIRNEEIFKNLVTDLSYNVNGVSDRWNLNIGLEGNAKKVYDAKLSLLKNSKVILDVNYLGGLNTDGGIMFNNRFEMRSSLPGVPQNVYLNNELIIGSDNVKTQHEWGTSPRDVHYSIDVTGRLINNRDMLALDGKIDGKWGRLLKGSVSTEMKTDMKNSIQWSSRVESDRNLVCSTRWSLARRDRLVEFDAKWEAPKMQRETSLKMRSGIEETESFIFETTLDRDQDIEKSSEISIRLPLQTRIIDGHMRIKMPRELGNQALRASLMAKESMISVNGGISMDQGRRSYQGEVSSAWDQDLLLNGYLKENTNDIVRAVLKASLKRPGSYELTAGAWHNKVSYDGKIMGEWSQKNGEIVMEAQSSLWDRKHVVRGSYSLDSNTGSLKVDIAKLKMTIDSMMSGSYKLRANANYDGKAIADVNLNYNTNSKQGNLEAVVSGKRMRSNFVARMANGELKLELPSGTSSLIWNLDQQDKMSVNGIWTFHSENWRIEAFVNPRDVREAEAKIFYKEKRVGTLYTICKADQASLKVDMDWAGEKHSTELGYTERDGLLKGVFKLHCPWLHPEPIDAEFGLEYSQTKVVLKNTLKVGSRIYSGMADGHIQGERVTGTIQAHCPYTGDMNGRFEGTINNDGFNVKLTSDKLKQPVEIDGKRTPQLTGFRIKSETYEMDAIVYTGKKYGFEFHQKTTRTNNFYEIFAVAENHKSLKMAIQTPGIAKTGLMLMEIAPNTYGVQADLLGRRFVEAKWTGTAYNMEAGIFDGTVDFGNTVGKHAVVVNYSLVRIPSLKIQIDGHVVVDGHFERGNHSMLGKWTMHIAEVGDVTVEVKHQLNNEQLQSAFKISQNGKTLGYELRLHEDILGSMLRIDTPKRVVLMELDKKKPGGDIAGRIKWDHGRDPQKSVQVFISPDPNNGRRGDRNQHRVVISIPKLGEEIVVRLTETEDGHKIHTYDELSMTSPRLSLTYSREDKRLEMTLGKLMMHAKMSAEESEFVVRRLTAQEADIDVGYHYDMWKTLSARLNWTPRLLNDPESTARIMLGEIQKGPGNRQSKQWRKISEFFASEIASIRGDLDAMMGELRRLYDQNTWNVKSTFESLVRTGGRVSDYVDSVTEQIEDMIRDMKRVLKRYSQRLVVASAVINALQQEITEDVTDTFLQWLARIEKSVTNEQMQQIVKRIVRFLKEDYRMIIDALDYTVDEYVCEFSTEQNQLSNKRCGFAYKLNSQHEQHGLTMRLPVAVMQS